MRQEVSYYSHTGSRIQAYDWYRKWYVALNDPERRKGISFYFCVILLNSVTLEGGANYVKVVAVRPILSAAKCSPENLYFSAVYN